MPVAGRSKAYNCSGLMAGIVDSNQVEGTDVCVVLCLCCVVFVVKAETSAAS